MTRPAEIGVALCTCEGAGHLAEQLDSFDAQTRAPVEVVVGDDASTDGTLDLLGARAADDRRITVLPTPPARLGLRVNLDRVLRATTAELVALSDQDDVWQPERLAAGERAFDAHPDADLVASDGWFIDAAGIRQPGSILRGLGVGPWRRHRLGRRPVPVVVRRSVANGNTVLVRRRLLDDALPLPEILDDPAHPVHPDRWLTWVAAGRGPIVVVAEALVAYRRHDDQATSMDRSATARARAVVDHERDDRSGEGRSVRARLEARAAQLAEAARRTGSAELDAAAAHLVRRARLARGPRRLPGVAAEVARGGYRWSGASAAGADLVRATRP